MTKLEELVQLREADYQNSYGFAEKHLNFITMFQKQFTHYLECGSDNICFVRPSTGEKGFWAHTIEIDDDCFFNFGLRLDLHPSGQETPAFNLNNTGEGFSKKGLVPPSALGFFLGVKQEESGLFTVKFPAPQNHSRQIFTVDPKAEEAFHEIFEFIYNELKQVLSSGLVNRIKGLRGQAEQFGFTYTD